MSRKMIALSLAALMIAGATTAGELGWFDMANCAMCKNISSHEGLMENITWEQHPISNGVVSVTTVDAKYIESYRSCHADMVETSMKMQQGTPMEMCGSCTELGNCMKKGIGMEYVKTSTGDVWIMTSDKPELVKEIQAWAARNKEEKAKMMKAEG
jgi:hypothetical protein